MVYDEEDMFAQRKEEEEEEFDEYGVARKMSEDDYDDVD